MSALIKKILPLVGIFISRVAFAVEPIDNMLPYQLIDNDSGAILVELRVYEVSRQTTLPADRPLVLIEGLDIGAADFGTFGRDQFEAELRKAALSGGQDFWEILLNSGLDLYLIDFKSFDTRIEDMAALLRLVLDDVWSHRVSGEEPFKVVGASMGGVIGRLALYEAEQAGIDHHASLFVSLDSPHKGAIIPLGIQGVLNFWSQHASAADDLLQRFKWRSVRQLLLRQQSDRVPGTILAPSADFQQFQDNYSGAIPFLPRTMAFSNGSVSGEAQTVSPFGQTVFDFDYDPFGPGNYVTRVVSFYQDGGPLTYNVNYLGFIITLDELSYGGNYFNIEAAPGGYRTSYKDLQLNLKTAIESLGLYSDVPFPAIVDKGQHCFIPVASALDLSVDMSTREGIWATPLPGYASGFDMYHAAGENSEHVELLAYSIPLEAAILESFQIDPGREIFYADGASTPEVMLYPGEGTPVYYAVEVTTDPRLFETGTTLVRDNSNFFNSFWGSSSPDTPGSLAPPEQGMIDPVPVGYSVPSAFFNGLQLPAQLWYRLTVALGNNSTNMFTTNIDDVFAAPSTMIHWQGDIDGDNDVDGEDLSRFIDALNRTTEYADMDNNGTVDSADTVIFPDRFGRVLQ